MIPRRYPILKMIVLLILVHSIIGAQDRPVAVKESESLILRGHTRGVTHLSFLDNSRLASSSLDHSLKIWDISSASCRQTLTGHADEVFALTASPDGKYLASTGYDRKIIIHEWTGNMLRELAGFEGWAVCIAISPDSTKVATCTMNGLIRGWEIQSGNPIFEYKTRGWKTAMAWSPDGNKLAVGNLSIEIWDINRSAKIKSYSGHTDTIRSIAWHPQGKMLASCGLDKSVRLLDLSSGKTLAVIKPRGYIQIYKKTMYKIPLPMALTAVTFSPDGAILAFGGAGKLVTLWDISTQEELRILAGHTMSITALAFSPDGSTLASSSLDRTLRLWQVR